MVASTVCGEWSWRVSWSVASPCRRHRYLNLAIEFPGVIEETLSYSTYHLNAVFKQKKSFLWWQETFCSQLLFTPLFRPRDMPGHGKSLHSSFGVVCLRSSLYYSPKNFFFDFLLRKWLFMHYFQLVDSSVQEFDLRKLHPADCMFLHLQ